METSAANPPATAVNPGQKAFRRYASDILRLPGVARVSYNYKEPDTLAVYTQSGDLGRLVDNAMRDSLEGANVAIRTIKNAPPVTDEQWPERGSNVIRAIAALRGIHDWTMEPGDRIAFFATSQGAADQLRTLVNDTIRGGFETSFVAHLPRPQDSEDPAGSANEQHTSPDQPVDFLEAVAPGEQ